MDSTAWALAALVGLLLATLAFFTAQGGRVRGHGWPAALVGGALFPLTWVAWYLHDGRGD